MKIAVEGCAHGELEIIYSTIAELEKQENVKIDLLICCGDFQSTRNLNDLQCMAVPQKYADICTFYKYYSGEKTAPYLTIFIGGNHEASNYLQELPYGGWVAPNIFYLGYAGVINIGGIRIGGISGIYKSFDYLKGHFEIAPYDDNTIRSVYHIRNVEVFRLKQLSQSIDVFLSHDWPKGIHKYGNVSELLEKKPFFEADIQSNKLGSAPCEELLNKLKPKYWFSAHLHCKFAALVPHSEGINTEKCATKFLALDKCLPRRRFLQIIDIPHDPNSKIEIKYDLEWLTILFLTNHLLSVKKTSQYLPGPGSDGRWNFTPTEEEKEFVLEKFGNDLNVPLNFSPTVHAYTPNSDKPNKEKPIGVTNSQTKLFCDKLCIDDPTELLLKLSGSFIDNSTNTSHNSSLNLFVPRSVEIKQSKLNLSLPEPQIEPNSPKIAKLNLTLPPPKNTAEDSFSNIDSTIDSSFIESETDSVNSSVQNVSTTSFSEVDVSSSTPQTKKFKRRNESIYKVEND